MTLTVKSNLASWSWQDIIRLYRAYGEQVQEYQRIKKSVQMEWQGRGMNELSFAAFDFDNYFRESVQRLDAQIHVLDLEIARRNNLIGVIG